MRVISPLAQNLYEGLAWRKGPAEPDNPGCVHNKEYGAEEVIEAVLLRLESQNKRLSCHETDSAIKHLMLALEDLEARQLNRKNQDVAGTRTPHESPGYERKVVEILVAEDATEVCIELNRNDRAWIKGHSCSGPYHVEEYDQHEELRLIRIYILPLILSLASGDAPIPQALRGKFKKAEIHPEVEANSAGLDTQRLNSVPLPDAEHVIEMLRFCGVHKAADFLQNRLELEMESKRRRATGGLRPVPVPKPEVESIQVQWEEEDGSGGRLDYDPNDGTTRVQRLDSEEAYLLSEIEGCEKIKDELLERCQYTAAAGVREQALGLRRKLSQHRLQKEAKKATKRAPENQGLSVDLNGLRLELVPSEDGPLLYVNGIPFQSKLAADRTYEVADFKSYRDTNKPSPRR